MKLLVFYILIFVFALSYEMSNHNEHMTDSGENTLSFIKDSTSCLDEIGDYEFEKTLMNENVELVFEDIPEDDFFHAVKNNHQNIKLFNKKVNYNEFIDNKSIRREHDTALVLGTKTGETKYFYNLSANENQRERRYFAEAVIYPLFFIKKIEFEDAETIIWNLQKNERASVLPSLSASVNTRDSVICYSNNYKLYPDHYSDFGLFKVKDNKLDTLMYQERNLWFTDFSFFETDRSNLYLIYRVFDGKEIKSTYAKIEYTVK